MKVGSLAIWTLNKNYVDVITPEKDKIYTVRSTGMAISHETPEPHPCIRVEEIVNGVNEKGQEMTYRTSDWQEVQPPMDISEIVEYQHTEIKELVNER